MPSDREIRERRREAIRSILVHEEPVEQQQDLVDRLRSRGFAATQSNVSRDLRDIGAVRMKGAYTIPSWTDEEGESPFRRVAELVRTVKQAGPQMILLETVRGAGPAVSEAIDEDRWEDLVGTVAGHNSVLLLTENFFFQKLVYQRLRYYMSEVGPLIDKISPLGEEEEERIRQAKEQMRAERAKQGTGNDG
jgi:transcriptional regulator of arginine metabolism